MTRVVWLPKKKKSRKKNGHQMMLCVSALPRKCFGFTSGAELKPNLQLEALDGRLCFWTFFPSVTLAEGNYLNLH